jgi:hypothetical protein
MVCSLGGGCWILDGTSNNVIDSAGEVLRGRVAKLVGRDARTKHRVLSF